MQTAISSIYSSPFFQLSLRHRVQTLRMIMNCNTPILSTYQLLKTSGILKKRLPTVLLTECFNEHSLPFKTEVKNTEIAHLFEHILLEYLCLEKIAAGFSSASFSGRTHWNWLKYPRGSFFISITMEKTDLQFLPLSLQKSILLLEEILNSAAS